jgi:RNA polymerase sigma factor (sigma-70 family)
MFKISTRLLAAQSDERLVALVSQGHERAFEALAQRYRRPLLRYCRRMRLSESQAEDVLQHALLQAWLALAGGAEVRALEPWLFRIVHNAAVNSIRASRRERGQLADGQRLADVASVPALGESELDRRIALRDALADVAALPRMQREAIFLTAVDGQTHDEVASMLGITHGALRGLLYRARATLRGAAAALTPHPLIGWALGGAGRVAPTVETVVGLSGGAGVAGLTGALFKGAVVALTAGVLVTGAGVLPLHRHAGAAVAMPTSDLESAEAHGLPASAALPARSRDATLAQGATRKDAARALARQSPHVTYRPLLRLPTASPPPSPPGEHEEANRAGPNGGHRGVQEGSGSHDAEGGSGAPAGLLRSEGDGSPNGPSGGSGGEASSGSGERLSEGLGGEGGREPGSSGGDSGGTGSHSHSGDGSSTPAEADHGEAQAPTGVSAESHAGGGPSAAEPRSPDGHGSESAPNAATPTPGAPTSTSEPPR